MLRFWTELKQVARRSWRATAIVLAGLGLLYTALNAILHTPDLSIEHQALLLLLMALACLACGLYGLSRVLRKPNARPAPPVTTRQGFVLACGLPLLLLVVPAIAPEFSLAEAQAGLFLWQVLALGVLRLLRRGTIPAWPTGWQAAAGALSGLGVWLAAVFAYSLVASPLQASLPLPLTWAVWSLGLLVAPWAEGRFWFAELPNRLSARFGSTGGWLIAAVLFALTRARLSFILPALLFALVQYSITRRTQNPWPGMMAQFVFNGLLFLAGLPLAI